MYLSRKEQFYLLIIIIIIILIYINMPSYNKSEKYYTTPSNTTPSNTTPSNTPQSNEAVQNIAAVYSDVSGTVYFNNLNTTNQATIKNLNVSNQITGNLTGNVTGNITGNVTGNITGNVTGNVNSPASLYTLKMQDNGNLVVYDVNKNPVFASQSAKRWKSIGPYIDSPTRVMPNYYGGQTIAQCQAYAIYNGDIYMGMQNNGACFTGSSDPTILGAASSTTPLLGGPWINQVWKYTEEP